MNCDCIKRIDARLEAQNLELSGYTFTMPNLEPVFVISTAWRNKETVPRNKRKSPAPMLVSFCPFCGTKTKPLEGGKDE